MSPADFTALLPLLILAGTPLAVMLAVSARMRAASVAIALAGLAGAFGSIWLALPLTPRLVGTILVSDRYALIYTGLIAAVTFACVLLAWGYFRTRAEHPEELYILLLIAALGSAVLAWSNHFASFYLGLEILSVSLYGLIAYERDLKISTEAGVKYLVLAAASASFLLFGMALIYFEVGTMTFDQIATAAARPGVSELMLLIGAVLIVVGVGFKLALVPFHMWTPDIYEGAPAPVTAYIATASKAAVFAVLLRYYGTAAGGPALFAILAAIAIASMLAGNVLALRQSNVKRILAYSSIAHLGYVLVALLAGGSRGDTAAVFYLIAYSATTVGAFAVVAIVSGREREADRLEHYRGLFWSRPALTAVFTTMLLSLAGLPATAGFIGKFYLIAAGGAAGRWFLIIILAAASTIGLFYYLRVIVMMYSPAPQAPPFAGAQAVSVVEGFVLGALTLIVLWLGVYPNMVFDAIARTF